MEEEEINSPADRLKFLLNQGALIGLGLMAVSLLFYVLGLETSNTASWITYLVFGAMLWWSLNRYRDGMLQGEMTYGQGVSIAFRLSAYASIILGFYTYIFISFIDSSLIDTALEQSYNTLLESGMSEEEADANMQQAETMMTPWFFAFSSMFGTTLFGFLFGLIISIFTKKTSGYKTV